MAAVVEQASSSVGLFGQPTTEVIRERRPVAVEQTPVDIGSSEFPDLVPAGWGAGRWCDRLRQLADACEVVRPDLAAKHHADADRLEQVIKGSRAI